MKLKKLPLVLIDRIAAGEVVDGPYSVVKELVENSIDAGASEIEIHTEGAGLHSILIKDNGQGIPFEDLALALERHTTSKVASLEDIERISSYGFRGEALAAISAISLIEIKSKTITDSHGGRLEGRGGTIVSCDPWIGDRGTSIEIRDLFFSTPARRKYLKSERTENKRTLKEIMKAALSHHSVGFRYFRDQAEIFHLPGTDSLLERIRQLYGDALADNLIEIQGSGNIISMRGYTSGQGNFKSDRDGQFCFVNSRPVEFRHLPYLVRRAYGNLLPDGMHPYFFLFFELDPTLVDVNVHPMKKEVRLTEESALNGLLYARLSDVLAARNPIPFAMKKNVRELNTVIDGNRPDSSTGLGMTDGSTGSIGSNTIPNDILNHSSERNNPSLETKHENSKGTLGILSSDPNSFLGEDQELLSKARIRKIHGVIYRTYILAELDDGFYIIDQHTAHERVNYEKKKRELEYRRGEKQTLLTPILFEFSDLEIDEIMSKQAELAHIGFDIDQMGKRKIAIREIPFFLEVGEEKSFLQFCIRLIDQEDSIDKIFDEYAAMKACKASIKRNDVFSESVLAGIVEDLFECKDPSRCPHGRPTMLQLTMKQLDTMFERI